MQNERPQELIPIYIMGKRYEVPSSLTIQKAMEYAGYQLIRGCGCRGGICGACGTVYRRPDSYRIEIGLACQTVVEPNMHLAQIPFFPANRASYNIQEVKFESTEISKYYPEIFKCVGCNTCTRSCPMDIDVMEYMSYAIRGDIERVAELSFDCVMCGLCAARCPAEQVQYHIALLCRRLYGKYGAPRATHVKESMEAVAKNVFEEELRELMKMDETQLRKLYQAREIEPEIAEEYWTPQSKSHL
jgi:heterodisulfide reductase subunit C